ncbi:ATPase [Thermoplasmatales archaeon SM1-50]|nr:MAG: ATPase [Thermoplasmatales archaeon SM1-50]
MPQKVIKKDGRIEPFIKEKIVVSAIKTGANVKIARDIAKKIGNKPEENIRTSWIRQYVLKELEQHNPDWPKRWYNYDKNIKRLHKHGLV